MIAALNKETILKYDVPGPRYTSYPTAPEWSNAVGAVVYREKLAALGRTDKTLSLYIHIPFCQSMCYFCACNVVIRPKEDRHGDEYLEYLFKEIEMVAQSLGRCMTIKQLHWGGGTPTFLSDGQIERLFKKLTEHFEIDFSGELSIEIDPRTIDHGKLKTLRRLGFNRVSMGIQDFDEHVQESVNRIQPFAMVEQVYQWCRELKFLSINYDLIYGLPNQTPESFRKTVEKVVGIKPDRIALYSFAYVPWLKKHQSKFTPEDMPNSDDKMEIFLESRETLLAHGYEAIAMDHFALKTDELAKAFHAGSLHRNFMGYTLKPADEFIGLGVSSIGFLENTFVQNHKALPEYYETLSKGELPVERGKVLSADDQARQWVINQLMCQFRLDKKEFSRRFGREFDSYFQQETVHIEECAASGLLSLTPGMIHVTDLGRLFIRNICMGFDWYLRQQNAHHRFSRTV